MRVSAIQTGMVAIKESQREGRGHGIQRSFNMLRDKTWTEPLPIYAWVIEHPEGVIVVDTGETSRTNQPGYFPRWHPYYRSGVREWVQAKEEIGLQLHALGIAPKDVRWLVMTHLHTDHAGGLHHFPGVEILVSRKEYQEARGIAGRIRGYLPNRWPEWFAPHLVNFSSEPFGPFREHYSLTQAGDVILVPTPGHTPGHLSVIVQDGEQALFLAGDTSYTQELLLKGHIDGVSGNESEARQTLQNIQHYLSSGPTVYLPSHDPESAQRLSERLTVCLAPAS